ncbi:SPOR domain-containing protein [Tepidamorphus sp. 3E244]|uniref:SPOR domain-containing protein n=1 Tax=Tepidamorphus sp. 3E244 TaxID=3385498 RepID=UPI0038FC11B2
MTHDRSTGGEDTLFADLERELDSAQSSNTPQPEAPSDDPLAELARLIESSKGQPAKPGAPQPAPASQPRASHPAASHPAASHPAAGGADSIAQPPRPPQPQARPAAPPPPPKPEPAASVAYEDDLTAQLEASLQGMDFSAGSDPFAHPGDTASDMVAPERPAPKPAQPRVHAAPARPAPQPEPEDDDPFASLESALSQVVAESTPQAAPASRPAIAASASANPYAAHSQYDEGYQSSYDDLEPGVQYEDGAPEFEDVDEHGSPYDDDYEYDDEPRSRRGVYIVGALLGLVIVGGAAAYGFKAVMGGGGDDVPFVAASDEPVKTTPEATDQSGSSQQGKLVYDRIGGNSDDPDDSQIVSREEQVAVNNDGRAVRVISGEGAPPTPNVESDEDSRRVRTLTVRPDGQIETPPPAPRAPEPEPQQIVQQQPAGQAPTSGQAAPGNQPVAVAPSAAPPPVPSAVATNTGQNSQPPSQLDVVRQNAQQQAQSQGVPLPLTRPSTSQQDQGQTPVAVAPAQIPQAPPAAIPQAPRQVPQSVRISRRGSDDAAAPVIASQPQQTQIAQAPQSVPVAVAPQQQAPAAAPQQQASVSQQAAAPITSGYVVQIASSRSEDDARSAIGRVEGQAGSALNGYRGQVQRADLGSRGVFYRAAFGPMQSMSEATSVCNRLKSNGIDCFVR